ncbi:MAG: hypothetical protein AAGD10_21465 [Myxococcota bacterium]
MTGIYWGIIGYGAIGLVFGGAFVFLGAQAVVPAAKSASLATRLLWWPGAAGLWPYLALRWVKAR